MTETSEYHPNPNILILIIKQLKTMKKQRATVTELLLATRP